MCLPTQSPPHRLPPVTATGPHLSSPKAWRLLVLPHTNHHLFMGAHLSLLNTVRRLLTDGHLTLLNTVHLLALLNTVRRLLTDGHLTLLNTVRRLLTDGHLTLLNTVHLLALLNTVRPPAHKGRWLSLLNTGGLPMFPNMYSLPAINTGRANARRLIVNSRWE
jgi:hypothetical protein